MEFLKSVYKVSHSAFLVVRELNNVNDTKQNFIYVQYYSYDISNLKNFIRAVFGRLFNVMFRGTLSIYKKYKKKA